MCLQTFSIFPLLHFKETILKSFGIKFSICVYQLTITGINNMKHFTLILFIAICLCLIPACGNSSQDSSSGIKSDLNTVNSTEAISVEPENPKDWIISLPDSSWNKEYKSGIKSWELYKEGCYDSLNSTMSVIFNNLNAEESMIASEALTQSMLDGDITHFDYEINGLTCHAYKQYDKTYDKTMDKIFYPLDSQHSLQINVFVEKGTQQGIDSEAEEVKQIIQDIVDDNELASGRLETETKFETIEITDDGLSLEGETFDADGFSVMVPEGWNAFTNSYKSTYIIKGGTEQNNQETKPSFVLHFNKHDAHTSYISDKSLYVDEDDFSEVVAYICGTPYEGLQYSSGNKSTGRFWKHIKIYLSVSQQENISIDMCLESSEFESISISDPDVKQVIVSLQKNLED